jgi:hypothetical protein
MGRAAAIQHKNIKYKKETPILTMLKYKKDRANR